jgi:hypothetical protein
MFKLLSMLLVSSIVYGKCGLKHRQLSDIRDIVKVVKNNTTIKVGGNP